MIKAVVFDFDLTLVDSNKAVEKTLKELRLLGLKPYNMTKKDTWGMNYNEFIRRWQKFNPQISFEELKELNLKTFAKYHAEENLQGIEVLNFLRKKGLKIGLLTNNSIKNVDNVVKGSFEFDIIYTTENIVDRSKDEILKEILEKWSLKNNELAYVGDHVNDVKYSKLAGVIAIGITSGNHSREELEAEKPDFIIDCLEELEEIIR